MKILIVEDEPSSRLLLEKQLSLWGHEVIGCADAEIALEMYQQTFYPLIITDLGLPGMDGLELCRRIRTFPHGKHFGVSGKHPDSCEHLSVGSVSWKGVGLPQDLDVGKTDFLGLQLVMSFVNQLLGTIEIKREQGTEFLIRFKNPITDD